MVQGIENILTALDDVRALKSKVPGLIDIRRGENFSRWSEGYTHAVLVMGQDRASIDAYRAHLDHQIVAATIEKWKTEAWEWMLRTNRIFCCSARR